LPAEGGVLVVLLIKRAVVLVLERRVARGAAGKHGREEQGEEKSLEAHARSLRSRRRTNASGTVIAPDTSCQSPLYGGRDGFNNGISAKLEGVRAKNPALGSAQGVRCGIGLDRRVQGSPPGDVTHGCVEDTEHRVRCRSIGNPYGLVRVARS